MKQENFARRSAWGPAPLRAGNFAAAEHEQHFPWGYFAGASFHIPSHEADNLLGAPLACYLSPRNS